MGHVMTGRAAGPASSSFLTLLVKRTRERFREGD